MSIRSDRPMPVRLLWPETEPMEGNEFLGEGLIEIIVKPITGAELMRKMFNTSPQTAAQPLVTQAA